MAGATVSRTLTVKRPVTEFPARSRASQTTDFEPRGKTVPLAGSHVTLTLPSTLSVALTLNHSVRPASDVASTTLLAGSDSTGGVVSDVALLVLLPVNCASAGAASRAARPKERAAQSAWCVEGMGNS